MLSYLDGTPLDRFESTPEERARAGATLARLRLALADFAHPHDGREIAWDVKPLPKLAYLAESVPDAGHRAKLAEGIDRFRAIEPALRTCRPQVVHNDFSRSNIVTDRSAPDFVTGVIDFGDVARAHTVIDVSTALLNQFAPEGGAGMFDRGRDLLAGYLGLADLTDTELRPLPTLVMARVIARAHHHLAGGAVPRERELYPAQHASGLGAARLSPRSERGGTGPPLRGCPLIRPRGQARVVSGGPP